jgi:hypothetical protein
MGTMRRVVAGLATLVVTSALLGCGDVARGPTTPTRAASALFGVSANSATTETTNLQVPVNILVFVPCANNGAGETVLLTGDLHVLMHVTESSSGNFHVKVHFQPMGISGEGAVTGDQYHGTGVTQEEFNVNGPLPSTDTFINNFRIIGQGPGNNFLVHQTFHITINANGEVTAFVDNFKSECK